MRCGKDATWLVGLPEAELWGGAYHGPEKSGLTLEAPDGGVHIESLEAGMVLWDRGCVTIDAIELQAEPKIVGAKSVDIIRRCARANQGANLANIWAARI